MPRRQHAATAHTPSDAAARKISQILIRWGKRNYQDFPWRDERAGWHALVGEVMLQRTRARTVVPVYERLVRDYPTSGDLSRASLREIEDLIFPLGLRWRAPLIRKLAAELALRESIPTDYDELRALPGVGDYIASAWLSLHARKRGVLIDANVVRFLCRLRGSDWDGETRRQKWVRAIAESLTPLRAFRAYNYAVLDFTMNICTVRPRCEACPIGPQYCVFGSKHLRAKAA